MSATDEIRSARAALEILASLCLGDRAETVTEVGELMNRLKEIVPDQVYAVAMLAKATDGGTLEEARKVLEQLEGVMTRTYPTVPQAGGLHGEDEILAGLLPGLEGYYVDVGAWRPVEQSNTWQFYNKGWCGLLIEPVPAAWSALLHQRLGDYLVPMAISNRDGVARLWANGPVSSFRPDQDAAEAVQLVVETRTLGSVLKHFPKIRNGCRLLSIDVEGSEREVLEGIDWSTFRPEVLVVEYIDHVDGSDTSGEWLNLVTAQGYSERGRTENNIIFGSP